MEPGAALRPDERVLWSARPGWGLRRKTVRRARDIVSLGATAAVIFLVVIALKAIEDGEPDLSSGFVLVAIGVFACAALIAYVWASAHILARWTGSAVGWCFVVVIAANACAVALGISLLIGPQGPLYAAWVLVRTPLGWGVFAVPLYAAFRVARAWLRSRHFVGLYAVTDQRVLELLRTPDGERVVWELPARPLEVALEPDYLGRGDLVFRHPQGTGRFILVPGARQALLDVRAALEG